MPVRVGAPAPDATGRMTSELVHAIIDTGAQISAIRVDIADRLALPVIGSQPIFGGTSAHPQVLPLVLGVVVFMAANGQSFSLKLPMTKSPLVQAQMLFGMDAMVGSELLVDLAANVWRWKIVDVVPPPTTAPHQRSN